MINENDILSEEVREEILMNENDILEGLLEADKFRKDESNCELIKIKRKGKVLFQFHIRPLSEEETHDCLKKATTYAKQKQYGAPKTPLETNYTRARSWRIYVATTDEDKRKVWENKKVQEALNVLTGVDLIDKVLLAGEKDQICDRIEDISGFNSDLEENAKK